MKSFFDYKVKDSQDKDYDLNQHANHVVVAVNVASKCGFTPQYEGLEELYHKYKKDGLIILGFPCNQFGNQEPGTNHDIQEFCSLNYNVSFPVLAKIDVNGANESPLYSFLKKSAPGFLGLKNIKWNFTKFLVDKNGKTIKRFAPITKPKDLEKEILKLLKK